MKWHEAIPVVISMLVILGVALLERQSKMVAAVAATMPLTVPLALWVVYSNENGEKAAVELFSRNLVMGMIPTLAFALAVWIGARAGLKLIPLLAVGYSIWAVVLGVIIGSRRLLGF